MANQVDSTSTDRRVMTGDKEVKSPSSLLRRFLELIRFSHTIFALPFAVLATVFAFAAQAGLPVLSPLQIAIRCVAILVCMVSARSAAMAFNRLVDAKYDAANPRTQARHLPAGTLTPAQVWLFFGCTSLGFIFGCSLLLPNWLPLAFSLPVLAWICGYSLAKRFTSAAHLWLGVALALSPICAWIAIRGETVESNPWDVLPAVGLAVGIALWVTGFDIIYACQDAKFDAAASLRSIPARLGVAGALRLSGLLHVGMLCVLAMLPVLFPQLSLGWIYYTALAMVGVLIIRQHAIVRPDDLRRVNEAFFSINAIISFGFCLAAALDSLIQ